MKAQKEKNSMKKVSKTAETFINLLLSWRRQILSICTR